MSIPQRWIGPMPITEFLSDFVPTRPESLPPPPDGHYFHLMLEAMKPKKGTTGPPNVHNPKAPATSSQKTAGYETQAPPTTRTPDSDPDVLRFKLETQMYNPFIDSVKSTGIMPTMEICNTSVNSDPDHREGRDIQIDAMAYDLASKIFRMKSPSSFSWSQFLLEFKLELDPFEDLGQFFVFMSTAIGGRGDIIGQLADYVTEQHALQHRVFSFMVFISKDFFRLIRADRDGFVVSERRSWRDAEEAKLLAEFLWRFDAMTPAQRGFDTTVSIVQDDDKEAIQLIKKHLSRWSFDSPVRSEPPKLRIEVPGQDGKMRVVYAWYPLTEPEFIVSRATRGYPVIDKETKKIMFLKDNWRSTLPGMGLESEIIRLLNDAGVRNVPQLVCGGDLQGQETRTWKYAFSPWRRPNDLARAQNAVEDSPGIWHRRVHHRLLEGFIGSPLRSFTSSKVLLNFTLDAFLAHKDAVEKCGILHRDISHGNILIRETASEGSAPPILTGILIDWEMAVYLNQGDKVRQPSRTGTWAFMSAACLDNPRRVQTIQDDMESFFWIVLWFGLRYLKHNHPLEHLRTGIASLFEESQGVGLTEVGGQTKYRYLRAPTKRPLGPSFAFECKPFNDWVWEVRDFLHDWYGFEDARSAWETARQREAKIRRRTVRKSSGPSEPRLDEQDFRDHNMMEQVFRDALTDPGWPDHVSDIVPDQCPPEKGGKRRRGDDGEEEKTVKKAKTFDLGHLFF